MGDAAERIDNVYAVGQFKQPRALETLVLLLEDPDQEIRGQAVLSIFNMGASFVVEPLLKAFHNPENGEEIKSLILDGFYFDKAGPRLVPISFLIDFVKKSQDDFLRHTAIRLLGKFPNKEVVDTLMAIVANIAASRISRIVAASSLSELGNEVGSELRKEIIATLMAIVANTSELADMREWIVISLAKLAKK